MRSRWLTLAAGMLALVVMLGIAGCGGREATEPEPETGQAEEPVDNQMPDGPLVPTWDVARAAASEWRDDAEVISVWLPEVSATGDPLNQRYVFRSASDKDELFFFTAGPDGDVLKSETFTLADDSMRARYPSDALPADAASYSAAYVEGMREIDRLGITGVTRTDLSIGLSSQYATRPEMLELGTVWQVQLYRGMERGIFIAMDPVTLEVLDVEGFE